MTLARRALAATLAFLLWFAPVLAGAEATTSEPPSVAAPPPTTVTDAVTHVTASEDLQRATLARLEQAGRWQELERRSTALVEAFEGLVASSAAKAELIDVITLARRLRVLRGDVSTVLNELESIARQLEHDRAALDSDARKWREFLSLLEARHVSAQILERAHSTEAKLQGTSARVGEYHDSVLLALDRTVALLAQIDDARARVASQEERTRAQSLQLEQSSLRQLVAVPTRFDLVADEVRAARRLLGGYLSRDGAYLAGLFVGVLALTGYVIERGTLSGTVTRIGIRSSTVRTGQGAEVIVPNGDLVSKEVVNWTRSDRRRRYDIDVGVAPGSDPEQVMRLLVEAAADVPEIMTNPAPRAMFKGFGDSSLNFTLLAWVPTLDVGLQAQNALRVAILRKLERAGIGIPFPQRDGHIQSVDEHAHQVPA